jgi:hypothetical protein
VGDIITIKKDIQHLLVLRYEHRVDSSARDGDYTVDELDVIPTTTVFKGIAGHRGRLADGEGDVFSLTADSPAIRHFYFEGGSMSGKGKPLKVTDVTVVGHVTIATQMVISYTASEAFYYG